MYVGYSQSSKSCISFNIGLKQWANYIHVGLNKKYKDWMFMGIFIKSYNYSQVFLMYSWPLSCEWPIVILWNRTVVMLKQSCSNTCWCTEYAHEKNKYFVTFVNFCEWWEARFVIRNINKRPLAYCSPHNFMILNKCKFHSACKQWVYS